MLLPLTLRPPLLSGAPRTASRTAEWPLRRREAAGAQAAAEKIRAAIETHEFQQGHLTASLGVAHCATADDLSPGALIARADQALYNAKRSGRNCVCTWEAELAALPRQTA